MTQIHGEKIRRISGNHRNPYTRHSTDTVQSSHNLKQNLLDPQDQVLNTESVVENSVHSLHAVQWKLHQCIVHYSVQYTVGGYKLASSFCMVCYCYELYSRVGRYWHLHRRTVGTSLSSWKNTENGKKSFLVNWPFEERAFFSLSSTILYSIMVQKFFFHNMGLMGIKRRRI
jgi:hypothetical protein